MNERGTPIEFDVDAWSKKAAEQKARRIAEGVDRWRSWLRENLDSTLSLPDEEIESRHDFIQWLFPIGGASAINPDAPLVGRQAMLEAVSTDRELHKALLKSWERMLAFYGLASVDGVIAWSARPRQWAERRTHNDRRISRMLHCMHNAGFSDQSMALMDFLQREFGQDPTRAESLSWWRHQVVSPAG